MSLNSFFGKPKNLPFVSSDSWSIVDLVLSEGVRRVNEGSFEIFLIHTAMQSERLVDYRKKLAEKER
jgi:hypothetical protein